MKTKKITIYIIIILMVYLFKNNILNLISKINISPSDKTEINILKAENEYLENELNNITNLNLNTNYKYDLTRLIYRVSLDQSIFYIIGGLNKNYKENNILINEYGVVGTIKKVYENYSKCEFIFDVNNLPVVINDAYGTLNKTENNLLLVENISNYDKVSLNDHVYTSSLGNIKQKLYLGYVYEIKNTNKGKKVYIKSDVDFYNINYLYVVGVNV